MENLKPNEIIPRIRELIDDSLLTEAAFAAKVGLGPSNLHKKLRGQQKLTPRDIKLICESRNVFPEWLKYGRGEKYVTDENEPAPSVRNIIINLARRLTQNEERIANLKRENQDIMNQLSTLYIQLDNRL
jgi:transcriptional regulator with XRE-family HTH domain